MNSIRFECDLITTRMYITVRGETVGAAHQSKELLIPAASLRYVDINKALRPIVDAPKTQHSTVSVITVAERPSSSLLVLSGATGTVEAVETSLF
jgi:uncharacterized membrane protein